MGNFNCSYLTYCHNDCSLPLRWNSPPSSRRSHNRCSARTTLSAPRNFGAAQSSCLLVRSLRLSSEREQVNYRSFLHRRQCGTSSEGDFGRNCSGLLASLLRQHCAPFMGTPCGRNCALGDLFTSYLRCLPWFDPTIPSKAK